MKPIFERYMGNETPEIFKQSRMLFTYLVCVSNLVLHAAIAYLDPNQLLRSEYDESFDKIEIVTMNLTYFMEVIQENREKLLSICPKTLKNDENSTKKSDLTEIAQLDSEKLFVTIKANLKRLNKIKSILQALQVFFESY